MRKDYEFEILTNLHDLIISRKTLLVDDLLEEIKEILGSNFLKHTFQINTPCHIIFFKDENGNRFVLKLERENNPTTTKKEVEWFELVGYSNLNHLPHFYGGYHDNQVAFYFLEFLDSYESAGILLVKNKLSALELTNIAKDAINEVEHMFYKFDRKKNADIVREAFVGRLKKRIEEMLKFPYLKQIVSEKEIVINNKAYQNLPYYIDKLTNSPILSTIEKKELGIIPGDLYFGNILVKDGSPFKFLDPNGSLYLPLEYDYGKILYSTKSGYDFLHSGRYKLDKNDEEYEFFVDEKEKRDEITKNYVNFLKDRAETVYFTNLIHTISSIPHHAKDVRETIATYLQTIIILDEFFNG